MEEIKNNTEALRHLKLVFAKDLRDQDNEEREIVQLSDDESTSEPKAKKFKGM